MKHLLLSLLILFTIQTVNAQYRGQFDDKKIFISLGGEIGAPSNTPYGLTYGGSAKAEIKLVNHLGLTLTGEYLTYNYKSTIFFSSSPTLHPAFTPLKAGLKYYTSPNFYLEGELGSTVQSNNDTGNMFVYSLGFGFEIPVNKFSDVDVSFRYENYTQSQYQTTDMRLAYRLGW